MTQNGKEHARPDAKKRGRRNKREADLSDVRIFVATPAYSGLITTGYLNSLLAAKSRLESLGATVAVYTISNESLISRARNGCVARFMAARLNGLPFTHLMFIDADISFPANAIERLVRFNQPIAVCCYPLKAIDYGRIRELAQEGRLQNMTSADLEAASLHYALNCQIPDALTDNFMPVFDAGSGFMCIRRAAVERLIEHYREQTLYRNNIPGYEQKGLPGMTYTLEEPLQYYALFEPMIDPETKIYLSEDYAFCRRWRQLGGTIWMDLESGLSHFGTHEYRGKIGAYLESLGILQTSG